jgi:hypothetical protein
MQTPWIPPAITAASRPSHAPYRDERLQRQVSTYLLYRSFSTDDRNRRGLQWWREVRRGRAPEQP